MILCDRQIRNLVKSHDLIVGFNEKQLQPFGYDIVLSTKFKVPAFSLMRTQCIDPFDVNPEDFKDFEGEFCIIPPNSYVLGTSVEYIKMPSDVMGLSQGRSSYVRCGVHVPVTPLEAGWHGNLTIEIYNGNQLPVKVYANKGICQVIFFIGDLPDRSYVTKGGKYQGQVGVTLARKEYDR
jgi:dCTP deaminase